MKISVDGKDLFELNDMQKQVICNDVHADIFYDDMKRRLEWILMHKYDECFKNLKTEWDDKLAANGIKALPVDKDEYCKLVFSQPNYQDRKSRDSSENLVA